MGFPAGKLPAGVLARMLARHARGGDRVLVGPRVGEDATVLDFGEKLLVAKTDPITFATDRIGWYAVHVCANDLAVMGARPLWFLAALLLPEGRTDEMLVESIFADLARSCAELHVALCGGHTEITAGLDRPIVVGHMLGEVPRDRLVTSSGARPGDVLLLTKGLAVEGTAILAREKAEALTPLLPRELIQRASDLLLQPGISVVPEAAALCEVCRPRAMHDATEGGLATALRELAFASGTGLWIDADRVTILPETRAVCDALRVDAWGLIASGALLAAVRPEDASAAVRAVEARGISCRTIGEVRPPESGLQVASGQSLRDLPVFQTDELARLFARPE
ncbi:MAG: AIR synthase family protein [Planctomycetes bacterium]|nr:AIR synthase family protein [Planctomycetota bacterium]